MKYLYFQNLDGLCLLNLKTLIEGHGQEVLLWKTFNSTNQVQYDARYERLLFFGDFETVRIVPLAHKNNVVPYGYNKLNGRINGEKVVACSVARDKQDEYAFKQVGRQYKRLVGVTESKAVVSWEYPTGKFMEKNDELLRGILDKND